MPDARRTPAPRSRCCSNQNGSEIGYDGDEQRRPAFTRLVAAGELSDGWAADDGAALVFSGTELEEVVASRPDAAAYRVVRTPDGGVNELALPVRRLGA
jgi:hypothetical protein